MATKRRGLGRGLSALLGAVRRVDYDSDTLELDDMESGEQPQNLQPLPLPITTYLAVELIDCGRYQPRKNFNPESLQELADSIATQGVLQPILVRPVAQGRYELMAGERRWRASKMAGLTEIPAVIKSLDEPVAMAIGLIENIQRDNLTPLEEAGALQRLLTEFELTHQAVAMAVGKSRTTVTNLLRLLDLTTETKQYLDSGQIGVGHARILLNLDAQSQIQAAQQVVTQSLSVRETEQLVRDMQLQDPTTALMPVRIPYHLADPDIRRLQNEIAERLSTLVDIRHSNSGKGKLVITYNNVEELDNILQRIK